MRDFFARQDAARRQSRWLLVAYFVALACVIGGMDVVAAWLAANVRGGDGEPVPVGVAVVCTTLLVGGFIACATLFKQLQLRGGGGVVARDLGGVRVDPSTQDPVRRRLMNVVEEMAIASGVPVPEVYVLEQEKAINALSAGHSPANAAIAVTEGMLRRLDRDQLQAVVAHEFSHILNGDMRLSIRLVGLNFGLMALALTGRFILRASSGRGRRSKGGGAILAVALAAMVLGYIGLAAGRVLQAMISRRREKLADASAVQFTRNPEGLRGALIRAAAQTRSARLESVAAEEVAHMLFLASGRRVLATHPPLLERLQALEPGFTPQRLQDEVQALQIAWDRAEAEERRRFREQVARDAGGEGGSDAAGDGTGGRGEAARSSPAGEHVAIGRTGRDAAAAVVAAITGSIGDPGPAHVARARLLREAAPERLERLATVPRDAAAFVLASLLADDPMVRERQRALLPAGQGGVQVAASVEQLRELAVSLAPEQRLPAVLKLFPALRRLPAEEQRTLIQCIDALSRADERLDVFEFALGRLVGASLGESLAPRPPHGSATLDELQGQVALLFSVLARHGAPDEQEARRAYVAGIGAVLGSRWPDYGCPGDWAGPAGVALDRLQRLRPEGKELLMEGLVRTVTHDGEIRLAEAELLRTVAGVLQCPLPPILAGAEQGA